MIVRWVRALGALLLLALIVVGVPLVLVAVAGWPFPGKVPDWDHVLRMLRQGEVPAEPVIKTLAVIVWIAWLQIVWALLWELAVNVPAQVAGRPLRPQAPLVAAPVSSAVGRLVAVILAVGLLGATSPASARAPLVAAPLHRATAPLELVHETTSSPDSRRAATRTPAEADLRWIATDTDTMWDVAEAVFGDGSRVGELLEMNPHIASARQLRPGQVLVVPAGATIPESRRPAAPRVAAGSIDEAESTSGAHVITMGPVGSHATDDRVAAPVRWSTHTVAVGDSVYAIAAEITAGDARSVGDVADQIIERNLGRTMVDGRTFSDPSLILPGWQLEVPILAPGANAAATATVDHIVVLGDSYWQIAEDHLRASGADPHPTEVSGLAATIRDLNAPLLGHDDPNMIHPGETVRIQVPSVESPTPAEAPASDASVAESMPAAEAPEPQTPAVTPAPAPVAESTPAAEPPAAESLPPAEAPTPAGQAATEATTPGAATPAATVPASAPAGPASSTPGSVPVAPTLPTVTLPSVTLPDALDDADRISSRVPFGLGAAVLLGAGALGVLEARRRHQLRRAMVGARLQPPTPDDIATETLLRSLDAPERALRLDLALRSAAHHLVGTGRYVIGALLADDATLTVLLDGPAPEPVAPWGGGAREDSWMLPPGVTPQELAPSARRAAQPCPALIHLGAASDSSGPLGELFVDLEALGVLALDADPAQVDALLTAIAASLSASPLGETLRVVTTGVDDETHLGNLNCESAGTLDDALEVAAAAVGSVPSVLGGRTFAARAGAVGGEAWEPIVVVAGASSDRPTESVQRLVTLVGDGGRGVGVVVAGDVEGARWVIRGGSGHDGGPSRCRLAALDLDVGLAGISSDELHALHGLLDAADRPAYVDLQSVSSEIVDVAADDFVEQTWDLMVRVLGQLEVVDRELRPVIFERGKALELAAWLSQHRERPTRASARTALWDLDVRDATFANVVSDARRAMARAVPPPAGEEWIERTLTEHLPLHANVVSDADLLRARVEFARRLHPSEVAGVLRPGLALVTDMPFAGTGYLWPDAEGITSSLTLLATGAATELARAYLALGDVDGVFWATGQGLKVLYGHEELIALRMRAHAHCGDLAGVRNEWEVYERALTADPWSNGEPSPKLVAIRRELLSAG